MELGALLGYGGAVRSLELLWRHDLMHLLLPRHAAYLKVGAQQLGRWPLFYSFLLTWGRVFQSCFVVGWCCVLKVRCGRGAKGRRWGAASLVCCHTF